VFRAAVRVADEGGIAALTMRKLAEELGVEAMSLYHHVADKDEVLAGMVDVVVSEISTRLAEIGTLPGGAGGNWKAAVRHTILAAREVLLGHPWAPSVIESRTTMSPTVMRYYDAQMRLSGRAACRSAWSITRCTPWAAAPWGSRRSCSPPTTTRTPA
jgi:AcrR family transcriptional regulator